MSDESKLMKKFIGNAGLAKEYNTYKKFSKKNLKIKQIQLGLKKKK